MSSLFGLSAMANTAPELHVLIDVSGSMKQTDPTNLRRPALRLLGDLLPPSARIGIWFFGDRVTSILAPQPASTATKARVRRSARLIRSNEPYTDIPSALDAAAKGWADNTDRNILLLSDGVVDISKDDAINAQAKARFLNDIIPRLQAEHIRVHTIALSKGADSQLLAQIAAKTGGIFVAADSAAALQRAFLKIFEAAAPRDGLPLVDNKFMVDKSVKELTILAFRDKPDQSNSLKTPDGELVDEQASRKRPNWHWDSSGGRDLITIEQPQPGSWQIIGAEDPDNRALIITDLKLDVTAIPTRIYPGEIINSTLMLTNHDQPVTKPALTEVIKASIQEKKGTELIQSIPLNDRGGDPDIMGGDGRFDFQLHLINPAGIYSMVATAESPTFQRDWRQNFAMAPTPPITLHATTVEIPVTPPAATSPAATSPPHADKKDHGTQNAHNSQKKTPPAPVLERQVHITQDPTVLIPEKSTIDGHWQCAAPAQAAHPTPAPTHGAPGAHNAPPAAPRSLSQPVHWVLSHTMDTFPVPTPTDLTCTLTGTLTGTLTTHRPLTLMLSPLTVSALVPLPTAVVPHNAPPHDSVPPPRSAANWVLIGAINLGALLLFVLGYVWWRLSTRKSKNQLLTEAQSA